MGAEIKKVVFPSEEELGEVRVLAAPVSRGWTLEPEEPAGTDLSATIPAGSIHAYIWQYANEAAAVLRSILHRDEKGDGPLAGMNASQIVAAFFVASGKEVGVRVLGRLDREEAAQMGKAVAQLKEVAHNAGMHALETVRSRIESGEYLELGGAAYAKALLGEVVAPWWADRVVEEANFDMSTGSAFKLLAQMDPGQIAPYISHEHPQPIVLLLSQLQAGHAAVILSWLPERMQSDVAYRMATMEDVSEEVLERAEQAIYRMFSRLAKGMQGVGGPKVVADVLNMTGSSVEKNVLDSMDAQDPKVAESVRNLMFVFDDIKKMTDREVQVLMKEVDQKDLIIALKAVSGELKEKILSNMSEKVLTFITEEMELMGPMRLSEVEETQLKIVQQVRQLEEKGEVTIVRGEFDEDQWV